MLYNIYGYYDGSNYSVIYCNSYYLVKKMDPYVIMCILLNYIFNSHKLYA